MQRLRHHLARWLGCLLCSALVCAAPALAQERLGNAQLDQLLAPVALYPDALLSQVLMASTYPADVAAAAQWSKGNPSLSGDDATKAVANEPWDPSVQSLAAFPSVLDTMGREPQWVQSLGDAFLAQPNDVMDAVQRLRRQAQQAGTLQTTEQQRVVTESSGGTTVVQIVPANPQVVYVPQYNPAVVYGAWAYPAYPPYYYPPPPGSVFATSLVAGIGFGLGVAAVNSMWGGFDWGGHDVNINVNRYNNINVHQRLDANRANVNWQHNPANRGNVPYHNAAVRNRYDQQRQHGLSTRHVGEQRPGAGGAPGAAAGLGGRQLSQRDQARERAAQSFQGHTGQGIPGHGGNVAGLQNRAGANSASPRVAGQDRQRADQAAARNRAHTANRDNAFRDAGNGQRLQQQHERAAGLQNHPQVQRSAAQPQRTMPARPAGGGGFGGGGGGAGHFGGGGGGAHFGHGRR